MKKTLYLGILLLASGCSADDPDEKKATTTPSGLKYYDVKEGDGQEAKKDLVVAVHIVGKVRDGIRFANSRDGGEPFRFLLGTDAMIRGVNEGVSGMKEGGIRKLWVPPELGLGKHGAGDGKIPPDSELLYEIELLRVLPGLESEDLKVGNGAEARRGSTVEVHYIGRLESGMMFDTSFRHGGPYSFKLGEGKVIKGWEKGVVGMKVGGRRKLIIQPELAYGKQGKGTDIPPDAVLVFEIELVAVK